MWFIPTSAGHLICNQSNDIFVVGVNLHMNVVPERLYFLGADILKSQVLSVVLINSVDAAAGV